ncbi:MAG TPA: protein translocase subunit SecD [Candidatus Limnocylindria bacterium]|jgi:preprotein translocase subunit SecD|nr:protein translocase subunit SecD [Candidatus Limnocylindria bacterium]
MWKSIWGRATLIAVLTATSIVLVLPSLTDILPVAWTEKSPKIHLGLDLQGGVFLRLAVEIDKAIENTTMRYADDARAIMREKGIPVFSLAKDGIDGFSLTLPPGDFADRAMRVLKEEAGTIDYTLGSVTSSGATIKGRMPPSEVQAIRANAVTQGVETIRNRIDQFGVREPQIIAEGEDRIVVQLPGVKDQRRAIELVGKTALLEFKLVDEGASVEEALKGNLPEGDQLLYVKNVDPQTGRLSKTPIVVKARAVLTGDTIKTARVNFQSQRGGAYVGLSFDNRGARIFDRVTAENVKRRLAIVLDDTVYSAPVIQERISGGDAQITGSFTAEEASDLAIVLRAGSLPAPVKIIQNVSVGPSLGRDSIEKGIRAAIIGAILVVGFMVVYYRFAGLVADIALIFNILFLLAGMSLLQATLTLPGIAGIILAIGMAVDSNVLIFERIREELRSKKTVRASIDAGYDKAFWTVVDSHVTTLITAMILFQFGTGPIKGFAVTLSMGVAINLFTALVCTKVVFDYLNARRPMQALSI